MPQRDPEETMSLQLLRVPSHPSLPWLETRGAGKGAEPEGGKAHPSRNSLRIIYLLIC